MSNFKTYVKTPFVVTAVEVTEDNIAELAPLIGELKQRDGKPFIWVDRRLVPGIDRAFPGWFITKLDGRYRCYSAKAFHAQFQEFEAQQSFTFEVGDDDRMVEIPQPLDPTA